MLDGIDLGSNDESQHRATKRHLPCTSPIAWLSTLLFCSWSMGVCDNSQVAAELSADVIELLGQGQCGRIVSQPQQA